MATLLSPAAASSARCPMATLLFPPFNALFPIPTLLFVLDAAAEP